MAISQVVTNSIANGAVVQADLATGVAGTGPAFSAYASAGVSVLNSVITKVLFQVENFDTNNNFASSRFTPTVAGYYQVNAGVAIIIAGGISYASLAKNGVNIHIGNQAINTVSGIQVTVSALVYMNGTTDYLEVYFLQNSGSNGTTYTNNNNEYSYFNGCLLRAA
jgi:hypothetical protein